MNGTVGQARHGSFTLDSSPGKRAIFRKVQTPWGLLVTGLVFFVMLGLKTGNGGGFVRESVEAIRQNQKSRCPEANKDAAALGMGLCFGTIVHRKPPDRNGCADGNYAELETQITEKATNLRAHARHSSHQSPEVQPN